MLAKDDSVFVSPEEQHRIHQLAVLKHVLLSGQIELDILRLK